MTNKTPYEVWQEITDKIGNDFIDSDEVVKMKSHDYPNKFWDFALTQDEVLRVLSHDPRFYKDHGASTLDPLEKSMLALADSGLAWVEQQDPYSHEYNRYGNNYNQYGDKWHEPYIIWSFVHHNHYYQIHRSAYTQGVFIPQYSVTSDTFTTSVARLHEGLNTLEDAKMVCARHFYHFYGNE